MKLSRIFLARGGRRLCGRAAILDAVTDILPVILAKISPKNPARQYVGQPGQDVGAPTV